MLSYKPFYTVHMLLGIIEGPYFVFSSCSKVSTEEGKRVVTLSPGEYPKFVVYNIVNLYH